MTAQEFWENKIIAWEMSRYSKWLRFHPFSWSIRHRLERANEAIRQRAQPDWSLLELGCGSGFLAAKLEHRCRRYTGIDFASSAIAQAKARGLGPQFEFLCHDLRQGDFEATDLTVFLGVTDWLNPDELADLMGRLKSPHLLFSFTDSNAVPGLSPYRLYRNRADQQAYRARNYPALEIARLLQQSGYTHELIARPSFHNPGALVWATRP